MGSPTAGEGATGALADTLRGDRDRNATRQRRSRTLLGLRSDRGAIVFEFIILFPFMMLLVLFFIEFGFVLHRWILINNAAAEGARYAATGNLPAAGTCPGGYHSIEERARETTGNRITCAQVTVRYTRYSGATVSRGDSVAVRISHTYATVTGFGEMLHLVTGGTFPSTLTMTSCADARLETRPQGGTLTDGLPCG
jgi:Flp pilus assembly protein TadG